MSSKQTNLTIRDDRPTALASTAHNANIDAIGFNIALLASRSPRLAIEVLKLYALAHNVSIEDPVALDEDYALFADEIASVLAREAANED